MRTRTGRPLLESGMDITEPIGPCSSSGSGRTTIFEMAKPIAPLGMLFTVALMAVFAAFAFWTAHVDKSWVYLPLGLIAIAACIGAALLRTWSQYLMSFLTAAFIA